MRKILPVVQGIAKSNTHSVVVNVLLDSASSISLIRTHVADRLGLRGKKVILELGLAGGENKPPSKEEEVELSLCSLDYSYISPKFSAVTSKLCTTPVSPVKLCPQEYSQLKHAKFTFSYPQECETVIDILVDTAIFYHLSGNSANQGRALDQPLIFHTKLGNVLGGSYYPPIGEEEQKDSSPPRAKKRRSLAAAVLIPDYLKFMSLEDIGVKNEPDSQYSLEDQQAVDMMNRLTTYDEDKKTYTTGLLWKLDPKEHLDSNYYTAKHCTMSARRKAVKSDKVEVVNKTYNEQIEAGFSEEIPKTEMTPDHPIYYIPTMPVYNPKSLTTKVRIVMNASSKCKSTKISLNECLYQGPNNLPDTVKILLRFRTFKHVVVTDISKMFWKIRIGKPDCDCLRYLWQWEDNGPLVHYRALSVTFGVISAPFQATHVVLHHCDRFQEKFPRAAKCVKTSLYMDDITALNQEREEAVALTREIYELFLLASMQPHKWGTTDTTILQDAGVPEKFWAGVQTQSLLGVQWNTGTDYIEFDFSGVLSTDVKVETKRTLIAQAARIYDPLGLLAPFTLKAKLLFSQCWKEGIDWDQPLTPEILEPWEDWKRDIKELKSLRLPRLITSTRAAFLAIFADASKEAYGACAYIVGENDSHLLFSKTRVAPIKQSKIESSEPLLTIARLELLASLIAARVATYILNAYEQKFITKVVFFTDSMITLWRIRNGPKNYKVWVANRVTEILAKTNKDQWHFCPGQLNPADLASRSTSARELKDNVLWQQGPSFLTRHPDQWPKQQALSRQEALERNALDKKEQESAPEILIAAAAVAKKVQDENLTPSLAEKILQRSNNWQKCCRLLVWILKFLVKTLSDKTVEKFRLLTEVKSNKEISLAEMRSAQRAFVVWAQSKAFGEELEGNKGAKTIKSSSHLQQFTPFIDRETGLIRSNTRLQPSEKMGEQTTKPIILPKNCQIVERLVLYLHETYGHSGPVFTQHYLRRQFRLIGGKREIARILRKCMKRCCWKPKPVAAAEPPLPLERTNETHAFDKIAVDMCGPFQVRHFCKDKKADQCIHKDSKAWVCVFTCMLSRAIHLEIAEDMSTPVFLQCFSRLCSRRGVPTFVWSDNARTFESANKELTRLYRQNIDWKKVGENAVQKGIDWRWGIKLAPNSNGVVERMVKLVKENLVRTMKNEHMSVRNFETVLFECEALINDRPISAPTNTEGDPEPISPSQLAVGHFLSALPFDRSKTNNPDNVDVTKMMRHRKKLVTKFWNAWRRDYVMSLAPKSPNKQLQQVGRGYQLKEGMIVMIRDKVLSKGTWNLARVHSLIPSKDGVIRRVILKRPGKKQLVERHIQQVGILETEI